MNGNIIQLEPKSLLDANWKVTAGIFDSGIVWKEQIKAKRERAISSGVQTAVGRRDADTESSKAEDEKVAKLLELIRKSRIEVADVAETRHLRSEGKNDYLKSEVGMNIILPKGKIEELRFKVTLKAEMPVVAIDGFPKDVIDKKYLVGGKITIGLSKAFKFLPVIGGPIGELLDVELNPWEFKLGALKKINVDFSGGLTSKPEWYFKDGGVESEVRVAMTIRKPKSVRLVQGIIWAAWLYDPGFFKKVRPATNEKKIVIC
jgi:hypothetical protein